ncbi:MAG: GNAT family N-acetyltransferase [Gordonia sp. (in: high G+C Gram-positive bacteria)]|uniref:GNAT family N-acetyltransferase n=1 Tax=Gordonia sp. (in: high G+C Gram-positive bacteria) TaxID=84139 RepID=UPI0039E3E54C
MDWRPAEVPMQDESIIVEVVDPGSPDAQYAVSEYYGELARRFPAGFDGTNPADGDDFRSPAGAFLLASGPEGEAVGCGGVHTIGDGVGEIKRMWVHSSWRGQGLGARLLRDLEALAAEMGHTRVRLDTNGELTEAIALYSGAGYRPVERYNDNGYATHFFEKDLRVG